MGEKNVFQLFVTGTYRTLDEKATTTNRSNAVTLARPKQLKFWHRWVRRHSLLPIRRSFKFTSCAIATRKDPLLFWHSQLYDVRWLVEVLNYSTPNKNAGGSKDGTSCVNSTEFNWYE